MTGIKKMFNVFLTFVVLTSFVMLSGDISSKGEVAISPWTKAPITNKGSKWRIGYCEAEPHINNAAIFYYIIQSMSKDGWIRGDLTLMPFTENQKDTSQMWEWLSQRDLGRYIEFPNDAHYIFNQMAVPLDVDPENVIVDRINQRRDIDILIIMGTKAGVLMANNKYSIPAMVFACNDAVAAGIVKSTTELKYMHVWAHVDPLRYRRQLQLFYDVFRFKKMGIVYEDSAVGQVDAALDDIKYEGNLNDFKVESSNVNCAINDKDLSRYYGDLNNAYASLAPNIDAFYLTQGTIKLENLAQVLAPITDRRIPVFSATGPAEVYNGALMCHSLYDFPNVGIFGAEAIERVLKGIQLKDISQIYESKSLIILNFNVANQIGYKPTFDFLLSADKIYVNGK